ncbi:hypothetical protein WJX73_009664 [Symbiochloris irregularis]|uniref:START domain-containing protein n=1 Tax=Symbiochloris irregularis TaxID=706552 RepID=A0AAW1PNL7_9CHLO
MSPFSCFCSRPTVKEDAPERHERAEPAAKAVTPQPSPVPTPDVVKDTPTNPQVCNGIVATTADAPAAPVVEQPVAKPPAEERPRLQPRTVSQMQGQSIEQVQAAYARDQNSILRALRDSMEALDRQLSGKAASTSQPASQQNSPAKSSLSGPSAPAKQLDQATSAAELERESISAEPQVSEAVRWIRQHKTQLEEIRRLAKGHRIFAAEAALNTLLEQELGMTSELLEQHSDLVSFHAENIMKDAAHVHESLRQLRDDTGWKVCSKGDLKVLYHHEHGKQVHSIKMQATLDCPLELLLSLAAEYDLMSAWNKYALDPVVLAMPSLWEKYVYSGVWLPFPFPHMDLTVRGKGWDLGKEEHCLLVNIDNVGDDYLPLPDGALPLPALHVKRKRVSFIKFSCFALEELPPDKDGKKRTRGAIMGHADPHIAFVPSAVINFFLKVFAPFVYKQVVQVVHTALTDPNSPFMKRINEKPEMYSRIREQTDTYLKEVYGPDVQCVSGSRMTLGRLTCDLE